MAPGEGAARTQLGDGALEHHLTTRIAGAGAEVNDVVCDHDGLWLVLDDEHRVPLVAQLEQQVVHALDVMGVQAGGRLVEDVGDIGERGAEVADHLGALSLTTRQRSRGPVQGEVAQADLDERVEGFLQRPEQEARTTARRALGPIRRDR